MQHSRATNPLTPVLVMCCRWRRPGTLLQGSVLSWRQPWSALLLSLILTCVNLTIPESINVNAKCLQSTTTCAALCTTRCAARPVLGKDAGLHYMPRCIAHCVGQREGTTYKEASGSIHTYPCCCCAVQVCHSFRSLKVLCSNTESDLQVQRDKDAAMEQAQASMEQAEGANAELHAARAEVQKLKTLLENVLVSPPA